MGGRGDDGYQVRYRLEPPRTRRGTALVAAAAGVVAVWLVATVAGPRAPERAGPSILPTQVARASPLGRVPPTLPPAMDRLGPGPTGLIPAVGDFGLAWFDPADGSMRDLDRPGWATAWAFIERDGSAVCVCYQVPAGDAEPGPRYVERFDASGTRVASARIEGWPVDPHHRVVDDVALDPAGSLVVAWAREEVNGWAIRVQVNALTGERLVGDTLVPDGVPASGADSTDFRLRLAPDGRHARISMGRLSTVAFPTTEPSPYGWTFALEPSGISRPTAVARVVRPAGASCFLEEWANAREFVIACNAPGTEGGSDLVLLTEAIGGRRHQPVFPDLGGSTDWILDQARGRLFLWHPYRHRLVRIDIAQLGAESSDVGHLIPQLTAGDDAAWPESPDGGAAWLPRGSSPAGSGLEPQPLVGSADGAVIYAAGLVESALIPGSSSTGIWVFDAETLELLDRWTPRGTYDALAVTPDGRYVVGLGGPTASELATFGSLGRTIAFHDAHEGTPELVVRRDTTGAVFLLPEPDREPT